MLSFLFIGAITVLLLGYILYGRFLSRFYALDDKNKTPANTLYDGLDYVPAKSPVLFGHHFASIAGAGPIVGPIIAGIAFGWLPAFLWIIAGSIFIGGVHDFSALVVSIRHKAKSIAQIAKENMSNVSHKLFLAFIWLTLIYVLVVFIDLTAKTFTNSGAVASASIIFIILAIFLGISIYRLKAPLWVATSIFIILLFAGIYLGEKYPISLPTGIISPGEEAKLWNILLIGYCFIASITPVWILLQPRDYLSSFLLYASIIIATIGILLGGLDIKYPAVVTFNSEKLGMLFPFLFITIACGACSGFHSVVASGTTAKQLNKETHAQPVGYGTMLLEAVLAIIALSTFIILSPKNNLLSQDPVSVFGNGIGKFFQCLGLNPQFGIRFGILTISTFLLTTLDTATRLSRYIFEEFFNLQGKKTRYFSTLVTLILPAIILFIPLTDPQGNPVPAWKAIWPVFGATNQLLAALALLVIVVWLRKQKKKPYLAAIPMAFMLSMTLWALIFLINKFRFSLIGIISGFLLILASILIIEAVRSLSITSCNQEKIKVNSVQLKS